MKQCRTQPGLCLFVLAVILPVAAHAASTAAVVKGVVRDPGGAPQMGALVTLLAPDATAIASAITDLNGHYNLRGITPGRYQMRATASLFLPALRRNLQLGAGKQMTVDLTLSAIFDSAQWVLPKGRGVSEPGDSWFWTLHSAENRPILRVLEDGTAVMEMATDSPHRIFSHRTIAMAASDGVFAQGGIHSIALADHGGRNGATTVVRADIGSGLVSSADLSTGYQRDLGYAGTTRMAAYYQKHPELGADGRTAFSMLSAQRMEMGDSFAVEVGSLIQGVHGDGESVVQALPFVKVTTAPIGGLVISYRMATARDLQSFDDMDSMRPQMPVAIEDAQGLRLEHGRHQEFSVSEKVGRGTVQAALYSDNLDAPVIAGAGTPTAQVAAANGMLTDSVTGTFRMLGQGYQSRGVHVAVAEPLTSTLWIAGEYDTGNVLAGDTLSDIHPEWAQAGMVAVEGKWAGGSNLRISYRWQPDGTITAVNPYQTDANRAYLSIRLRKPIRYRQVLPDGLEAVVDVSNLLAQGYRPVGVSADGGTLYLAQTSRAISAGLAFTF